MQHGYSMDDKSSVSFGEPKSTMDRVLEAMDIMNMMRKKQENTPEVNGVGGGYMANKSIFGDGFGFA